jgi:hypothetical protein
MVGPCEYHDEVSGFVNDGKRFGEPAWNQMWLKIAFATQLLVKNRIKFSHSQHSGFRK